MHVSIKHSALFLIAVISCAHLAFAWDRPCHSLTADIAYSELAAHHPEVILKVVSLLKKDADYSALLNWKDSTSTVNLPEGEMLLQLAARWPDDIKADHSGRDKRPHNTHPYHYIDLPAGPGAAGHAPKVPNLFTVMADFQKEWPSAPDERRAQLLCWFIHLIGDSHQPLHAASYFNGLFPNGDGGGNSWKIHHVEQGSELHAFWDNIVIMAGTNESPASLAPAIHAKAIELVRAHPRSAFPQLAVNKGLPAWTNNETFPLAIHVAYQDGKLPLPEPGRPTWLTSEYIKTAKTTAESQITLAGYRTADFLTELFSPNGPSHR